MKHIDPAEIDRALAAYEAQHHAPAMLAKFSDVTEQLIETLQNGREYNGESLPWRKTDALFRFRPQELTVWAGFNGHGKTLVLSDIMANSITHHGTSWALASFEMPLLRLAERFAIQCAGSHKPAPDYVRRLLSWTDGKVWVFDETDSVRPERVFAFCQYAFERIGVDHVVIDSLVKCGVSSRENEPQKAFVDGLQRIAKHYGGHIHLVHHLRKGDDEETVPNKQDLKGAGEIGDLADNVILVHRNKRKEHQAMNGQANDAEPDARLIVEKQRHFEWTGSIALWFESGALRYLGSHGERRKWYGPSLQDMRDRA